MGSAVGAPNGAAAAGDHMPLGSVVIDMRVPPAKKTESRLSRCWKVRKESLGAPRQQHWCWRGLLCHVLLLLFTDAAAWSRSGLPVACRLYRQHIKVLILYCVLTVLQQTAILQSYIHNVRSRPLLTIAVPVVTFMVLCSLSIMGVILGATKLEYLERSRAESVALDWVRCMQRPVNTGEGWG
jgi:hypothetical protein